MVSRVIAKDDEKRNRPIKRCRPPQVRESVEEKAARSEKTPKKRSKKKKKKREKGGGNCRGGCKIEQGKRKNFVGKGGRVDSRRRGVIPIT